MSAGGATSGVPVRNTAVPGTRVGFDFASMRRRSTVGIESRLLFSLSCAVPRDQVHMVTIEVAPSKIGTQPPSSTFTRLAPRKDMSMARKKPAKRSVPQIGQFHNFRTTMAASAVSTAMEAVTAMP